MARYLPNHIPPEKRVSYMLLVTAMLTYGIYGIWEDDLWIPAKHGDGVHFHGFPAWVFFAALLLSAASVLTIVVDHYDRRNNEDFYGKLSMALGNSAFLMFISAIACQLLVSMLVTGEAAASG
ncbi:hypothetical protein LBMAG53_08460 [Planctomycetota bacterium]|nr:hypothetical protein LBMAG53_08460 [Planctomycetota bacterium]